MLSNATILLVRHGEKENPSQPDEKATDPFLSNLGWKRAQQYVDYFHSYCAEKIDGTDPVPIKLTHLFASADHLDDWVRCINEHLMPDDTKDPPGNS